MAKTKKRKQGGARPGAGRPATGVNTVFVGFSVHKDYAEEIKKTVKEKLAALKGKKVVVKDLNKQSHKIKPITEPPPKSNYTINKKESDFITKRRNKKLGIK